MEDVRKPRSVDIYSRGEGGRASLILGFRRCSIIASPVQLFSPSSTSAKPIVGSSPIWKHGREVSTEGGGVGWAQTVLALAYGVNFLGRNKPCIEPRTGGVLSPL